MCMNTSPNVPESLKLLRFIGIGIFSNQIALYQGDNSEMQNAVIRNKGCHGTGNLEKDLFLGHLQPRVDKKFRRPCDFDVKI